MPPTQRPDADALQQLLQRARHDTRSSLHAVTMLGSALLEDLPETAPPTQRLFLERLVGAGARLRGQCDGLFRWLELFDGTPAQDSVPIALSIRMAASERGVTAARVEGDGHWAGDDPMLGELLGELLGNVKRFVAPGEEPVLHAEVLPDRVLLHDGGIGVPESSWDEVFAPYRRLHTSDEYPGAGMGLTIARRIAELHGGTVRFVAPQRGGATIELRLPRAA